MKSLILYDIPMGIFRKKIKNDIQGFRHKKKNENLNIEEKKALWTERWDQDHYDPRWTMHSFPEYIQRLIDDKVIPQGASLLDIGCGDGSLASMLAESGFNVLGFDFAETAIEKARQDHPEAKGKLKYICADATKPFPLPDTFRVGIDRGTFHTIPPENRNDYVQQIAQLIDDKGYLIIIYPLRIAIKLPGSDRDDPAVVLKDHLSSYFGMKFHMEDFREIMMQRHKKGDSPGFLVILRRRDQP